MSISSSVSRPDTDGTLGNFLKVIRGQETRSGADFVRLQSDVYDRVIRRVFDIKCDCE